tara:strand:- start:1537 stop:2418 length:882 start_codon:yes stop_codon:yes gene_type:complete
MTNIPSNVVDKFKTNSKDDVFEVRDHFLYRNGVQVPYYPHEKRDARSTINVKFFTFHFTAGRDNIVSTANWLNDHKTKADVQLIMDRSGNIIQMAPLNEKCWHMGRSEYKGYTGLNSHATGIEVINPGPLELIQPGLYKTWFGKYYHTDEYANKEGATSQYAPGIQYMPHHLHPSGNKGWLPYTESQTEVLKRVATAICDYYDAEFIGHDETTPRKTDPGPISPLARIRDYLSIERTQDGSPESTTETPLPSATSYNRASNPFGENLDQLNLGSLADIKPINILGKVKRFFRR